MCDFKPGDEVVCIGGEWATWGDDAAVLFPATGSTYTVSSLLDDEEGDWLILVEFPDHLYVPSRFRKVQRRSSGLSVESFLTIKPGQFEEPKRTPAPAVKPEWVG